MNILFYDAKSYDKESFQDALKAFPAIHVEFTKTDIAPRTAAMAEGFDAVCAFVSSDVSAPVLDILYKKNVKLVLMRCAGFNNVDLEHAKELGIRVMRVPGYSPEAVAEHAMALALACNRRIYKAYNKVRENDFSRCGNVPHLPRFRHEGHRLRCLSECRPEGLCGICLPGGAAGQK